jgi:mono/diheme cytochrome c family protein
VDIVMARTKILPVLVAGVALLALVSLSAGCTATAPTSTAQPPAAVTTPPSTTESPTASTPTATAPAVTGIALGKLIFETGNDNAGMIAYKNGIAKIKVQACKNCHGADAKGIKKLGPDIRGSVLQPDFTEVTFARSVVTGVDDAGKKLESKMPRFQATPEDTAALWLYVNSLK